MSQQLCRYIGPGGKPIYAPCPPNDPKTGKPKSGVPQDNNYTTNAPTILDAAGNAIVQGVVNALVKPIQTALPGIAIRVGLFMFALVLVIVGFWILTSTPPTKPAGAVLRHIQKVRGKKE